MSERRFSEDEVREIFDRAAQTETGGQESEEEGGRGLTLQDLKEIGAEAGLSPDAIARAAAALTETPRGRRLSYLGVPVGVSQSVPLGRTMSDAEWSWLVMRLRETFHAHGRMDDSGRFREWWNGNLRISIEPTEEGDVLHMSTVKSGVREMTAGGLGLIGFGLFVALIVGLKGQLLTHPDKVAVALVFAGAGIGTIASNFLRLPPWFKKRKAQFEALARSVLSRGSSKADKGEGTLSPPDSEDGLLPGPG